MCFPPPLDLQAWNPVLPSRKDSIITYAVFPEPPTLTLINQPTQSQLKYRITTCFALSLNKKAASAVLAIHYSDSKSVEYEAGRAAHP